MHIANRARSTLATLPNINRDKKAQWMKIALSQTKILANDAGVSLDNIKTVVKNIQRKMNNDSISDDFIKSQINIMLYGNSTTHDHIESRHKEIAKTIITAIIIMARHTGAKKHLSWFPCTTPHTHTINEFIKILNSEPPEDSDQSTPQQLADALKTLHSTIIPCYEVFESLGLLTFRICDKTLKLTKNGFCASIDRTLPRHYHANSEGLKKLSDELIKHSRLPTMPEFCLPVNKSFVDLTIGSGILAPWPEDATSCSGSSSQQTGVSSSLRLTPQFNQANDALDKRQEVLGTVVENTRALANSAANFEDTARQFTTASIKRSGWW